MDEESVYFEAEKSSTLPQTRSNTVLTRCLGCSNRKTTVCVSLASDGTKLLFFCFSKRSEMVDLKNLLEIVFHHHWVHIARKVNAWKSNVCTYGFKNTGNLTGPYFQTMFCLFIFFLSLARKYYRNFESVQTSAQLLFGDFTGLLKLCNRGFIKFLKSCNRNMYVKRASEKYRNFLAFKHRLLRRKKISISEC